MDLRTHFEIMNKEVSQKQKVKKAKTSTSSKKHRIVVLEDDDDDEEQQDSHLKGKEEKTFLELIEPYKENEFIPLDIIPSLLQSAFPSCEVIHSYSNYHKIIKIKIEDLLEANITNWQYNRPPDLSRCHDIARYIYTSRQIIDTMLCLSFNNRKQSFDVIDGIHRYTSLKIIKKQNRKQLDLLTPSEFGNNNDATWLFDSYVIINVRINTSEGELIELFKTLNKSNPIPELYIKDINQEKRDVIEKVSNKFCVKYKSHFSSNVRPNKPNINRDRFIDMLDKIYIKYNLNYENNFLLEEMIENLNTYISFNIPSKLTESVKTKCSQTGCWLFIYSVDEIEKLLSHLYKP